MSAANGQLERLLMSAAEAQRAGQLNSALKFAQQAVTHEPGSLAAKFVLGTVLARKGEFQAAEACLLEVVTAEPQAYEPLISLSTVYRDAGRLDQSIEFARKAVNARPGDAHAHNNLGRSLLSARRLDEAAVAFQQAIRIQPRFSAAHYNLGKTRQLEGRDGEAANCFAQAASLSPTLENLLAFGHMLLVLCDYETAHSCSSRCVEMFPSSAAAHLLLCGALTELQRFSEAEEHLKKAQELDLTGSEALQLAARLRPLGHLEEANENLRRAIAQNPRQVSAYDSLMQNQKVTERDRELVEAMTRLLQDASLSPTEMCSIHYGLGKALEDLGEFESAMSHYDAANFLTRKLKFGEAEFDGLRYRAHVDRLIDGFSSTQLAPFVKGASQSDLPILIVGMMRSGTTLAEQILSCHPEVGAAGEQLFWSRNWARALEAPAPDCLEQLSREYLELLTSLAPGSARVTDKMPGNALFSGLIHLALPNARIIHIRRSPIDTCLSIWATPNHMPHDGGNDKAGIAFVYREYLRAMEHWRALLPPDRFLEVDYEELVSDREAMTRKMVEFCGLEWDEACLLPEQNRRTVLTPSAWQVRQPVYATSVQRWRKFEPWLGEFRQLLDLKHPPTPVH